LEPTSIEKKWWVAGIATAPLYLVTAISISGLGPLIWLISFVGVMFVTGILYQVFVVRPVKNGSKPLPVLLRWLAVQISGIAIIVWAFQA
jgi:hypothetical protein